MAAGMGKVASALVRVIRAGVCGTGVQEQRRWCRRCREDGHGIFQVHKVACGKASCDSMQKASCDSMQNHNLLPIYRPQCSRHFPRAPSGIVVDGCKLCVCVPCAGGLVSRHGVVDSWPGLLLHYGTPPSVCSCLHLVLQYRSVIGDRVSTSALTSKPRGPASVPWFFSFSLLLSLSPCPPSGV
jgi:hypothetical protein